MAMMDKKKTMDLLKIIIPLGFVLIIFASLFGMGVITTEKDTNNGSTDDDVVFLNEEVTATVIINYGDGDVDTYDITSKNDTVFGFLLEAANQDSLDVKTTYYGQYDSILVDSIGSYVGGDGGKYWQYYLNEEYGIIGVDKQMVSDGDTIVWKFEGFS